MAEKSEKLKNKNYTRLIKHIISKVSPGSLIMKRLIVKWIWMGITRKKTSFKTFYAEDLRDDGGEKTEISKTSLAAQEVEALSMTTEPCIVWFE